MLKKNYLKINVIIEIGADGFQVIRVMIVTTLYVEK